MQPALQAIYHVRSDARVDRGARARDRGRAERGDADRGDRRRLRARARSSAACWRIEEMDDSLFEVRIALAAETVGHDPGSCSTCCSAIPRCTTTWCCMTWSFRAELAAAFGGPRHGLQGCARPRRRAGAGADLLGAEAAGPAARKRSRELARRFAQGGIDYIKDDHGLADQAYSPFAARVDAVAAALGRPAGRAGATRYVPSLSGDLDAMRRADRGRARAPASIP